ncbi:MAG: spermidine/putrescine ABC transporter substrate-binding protein [Parachlamydia sp.]|nr:spermidine/putrescine ABC transporter substrate-binding protein [Parachlamydia sp.]
MNRFLLLLCLLFGCQSNQPVLHLYIWSDAIAPHLLKQFEERYHCRVVVDTYDSNEALYAKLKLGATGYDLIFPSNYLIGLMAQNQLLLSFDASKIPNLSYLDPSYPPFKTYGIPYLVSYTGIGYRKDKVSFNPTWEIFADSRFKGRMTLLNDFREALGASLRSLGFSANSTNPPEISQAVDRLIGWKRNLAKFESEQYKNGIASAEYLIVQGYTGDMLQVMRENPMVAFAFPEEGTTYAVDYAALLKGAPQPDLAHAFLNYLLEPEVAKENILFTCYLHPCKPAYALLPKELQSNETLFPPEQVRLKAEQIEHLGKAQALYTKAWDRVKEE